MKIDSPVYFFGGHLFTIFIPLGYLLGTYFNFLTASLVYIFVPLIDFVTTPDTALMEETFETSKSSSKKFSIKGSATSEIVQFSSQETWFRLAPILWTPIHFFMLFFAAYVVSKTAGYDFEFFGLAIGVGILNGASFVVSHELCHSLLWFERFLGKAILMNSFYMHFSIEHVYGHHKHVGTPSDPATALLNESIYQFIPRTLVGSWKSAWNYELQRLQKENKNPISIHNQMIWFAVLPVIYAFGFFCFLGLKSFVLFMIQAAIGFLIFENINYVEHYGLLRTELSPGKYEPIGMLHSWNANTSVTNMILLKIQRHSDHHVFALKPYQTLIHFEDSPQLPAGYAPMMVLSWVPPLWFSKMNPLAKKYNKISYERNFPNKVQ